VAAGLIAGKGAAELVEQGAVAAPVQVDDPGIRPAGVVEKRVADDQIAVGQPNQHFPKGGRPRGAGEIDLAGCIGR
jgi:hypothetical protein